jgi:hypothetical protein
LAAPTIPPEGLLELQRLIVARSHEIAAAAGTAERQSILARRARADRVADPSLGVRLFSERGGEEQGAGLFASLPLGGGDRRALSDQAAAEAGAAQAERVVVEREVSGNAAADVAEAGLPPVPQPPEGPAPILLTAADPPPAADAPPRPAPPVPAAAMPPLNFSAAPPTVRRTFSRGLA